jgi:hypothetical protein
MPLPQRSKLIFEIIQRSPVTLLHSEMRWLGCNFEFLSVSEHGPVYIFNSVDVNKRSRPCTLYLKGLYCLICTSYGMTKEMFNV